MKRFSAILRAAILLFALAACSTPAAQTDSTTGQAGTQGVPGAATSADSPTTAVATTTPAPSVAAALAGHVAAHDDDADASWDAAAVIPISLNGDSISASGEGVAVAGSTATISAPGTYSLSGSLADGQIVVDSADKGVVRLILDGATISSSTSAAISVVKADEVVIVLADGSQNAVSDATTYVYAEAGVDEPNAAIFSAADLTISGGGSLSVSGNANDGIASKDGLVIAGGMIAVSAVDDGIRGKDYLVVRAGSLSVTTSGDGLKADNEEDAARGYVAIESGDLTVSAGGDAITAASDVLIADGTLTLASGGGSGAQVSADASAKGIKAALNVNIDGGTLAVDAADDAIHSNANVTISGGTFALASADDGIHADAALTINGGDITISQSYEGLESGLITINDGNIRLVAQDDGVNVSGGVDGSGGDPLGGGPGGRPSTAQETFSYTGANYLNINGGYLVVDSAGDGLDSNGAIVMTGGTVLVNGPTEQMNGALDYDGGFKISGGLLVAAGSSGMAEAPGAGSTQSSVLINYSATQPAGSLVHIQDSAGADILTFAPSKAYQSIAISSPDLAQGATYTVTSGGSATGAASDGWYPDGGASGGSEYATFTLADLVTQVGTRASRMR
jgi:hypothetical protein